jgi:hypothetical protein
MYSTNLAKHAENPQPAGPSRECPPYINSKGEMDPALTEDPLLSRNNLEWLAETWDDLYNYLHVSLN